MSWLGLFGLGDRGQTPPDLSSLGLPPPPPGEGGQGGGSGDDKSGQGQSRMEAYRFDSAALERAAKAARDLEKSRKYCHFNSVCRFIYLIE